MQYLLVSCFDVTIFFIFELNNYVILLHNLTDNFSYN